MINRRVGCQYCFETLDPESADPELRTFVRCQHCGKLYHAKCWTNSGTCIYCTRIQADSISLRPLPLQTVSKRKSLSAKPSSIVHARRRSQLPHIRWRECAKHCFQVFRATVVAAMVLFIAVEVGSFGYYLLRVQEMTVETVIEAAVGAPLPVGDTQVAAVAGGMVGLLVFYGRSHPGTTRIGKLVEAAKRLVAAIVGVLAIDAALLGSAPWALLGLDLGLVKQHSELLYVQAFSLIVVLLSIPFYRNWAPMPPLTATTSPTTATNLLGLGRLLLVTALILIFVMHISTRGLPSIMNQPTVGDITVGSLSLSLTLPMTAACVAGTAVACLVYRAPKFRRVQWHFGVWRLLVLTACLTGLALMYRAAPNPEAFLRVVVVALGVTLLAVPVQRTFS